MARLKHIESGRCLTLGATTVVGRSSTCGLTLTDSRTSGQHATIGYDARGWSVRDLASRNGTFVDGDRIAPGVRVALAAGAEVRFADDGWRLLDDGPPVAAARCEAVRRLAEGGLLALPGGDDPAVTVYRAAMGRWLAEEGSGARVVSDGDVVEVGDRRWTLELPPPGMVGGTRSTQGSEGGPQRLDLLTRLTLAVSRDEETVEMSMRFADGAPVALPPRSFGYLLVVLTRARTADAEAGVEPAEQGWMYAEDVCREVGIEPGRLNVEVYRCRRLLAEMGVEGAAEIFERRPHTRQIRLGVGCGEVVPIG